MTVSILEGTSRCLWPPTGADINPWQSTLVNYPFRPDTLDPALLRPGRLDRRIEFSLPDAEGRAHIMRIHARSMSVERDIRFDLIARLCPNTTGAELRSVATEAGMFAIRARRKVATERDFLDAVEKVVRQGTKFSSTSVFFCSLLRSLADDGSLQTAVPSLQLVTPVSLDSILSPHSNVITSWHHWGPCVGAHSRLLHAPPCSG